jgi:hypothetical protein
MAYLGLVPSERSSGQRVARGSITKTGNADARRLLTEVAWNYRFQPRIGYQAQRRAEDLPQAIRDVAWKAQLRLSGRFGRLRARGVQINKVCVAVARECFGWLHVIGGMKKVKVRGQAKVEMSFVLASCALNLLRIARLAPPPTGAVRP